MDEANRAWRTLLGAWSWEPSVLLGLAGLAVWYLRQARREDASLLRLAAFAAGLLALLVALVSPLDLLADRYLFSAHMAQHLLLVAAAPPLLLLGLSGRLASEMLRRCRRAERLLAGNPLIPLALLSGALVAWHVPELYEAALASAALHVAEHLVYLGAGVVFWWPVVQPELASASLGPLGRILYLFAACLPNTALGAVLTFARAPFYQSYAVTADPLGPAGLFPLTRGAWGLTPLMDQQLGGLLMWIPGGLVYLVAIGAIFLAWYNAEAVLDGGRREELPRA